MEWQRPEVLYLILPLCAAWFVLALDSNRRRHRARLAFVAPAMWSRILPDESRLRFWTKLGLREVAMVMGLVALAGPRFGTQYEQVVPRGADLYVLIDVSRSMLADDVPPSRLGRAKADVSSLLNRLQGERVGLIAFAGQAVVKCPLTVDYDSFRRSLDELDPDSAPRGGTAIGDAIRKGLEVFHSNADRDRAMLLITDGDDQQSYPLEAAAVANERHVTIFTIGLGDAERGARIPLKTGTRSFVEYQGEQVWSKLDGSLLEQIALKTSGVYVPAGLRTYDLGELYTNHLQGRQGNGAASQQRIRRSERFQMFLAMALASLLIDLCIAPYRRVVQFSNADRASPQNRTSAKVRHLKPVSTSSIVLPLAAFVAVNCVCGIGFASEPDASIRDGLRLYSKEQYDEARAQFAAAGEELDKRKSAAAAIAAFDEACAAHRKGDLEHARDCYLRAGLSQDRSIAIAAHFNLGTLSAEQARTLSSDKPELVPTDKRQEILDQLSQAIVAYRHVLELQSDHAPSRRNIELVRQWIKYYSDKWRERDRQKRRDESNLVTFLEYLIQSQATLRETVKHLPETVDSDTFAEMKRAQEELQEEIPTLREKIGHDLRPQPDPQSGAANAVSKELEEGITRLQSWADTAGEKMSAASRRLGAKEPVKAATDQQMAIDELDKIWESVIAFHPLLAKELADQTKIARALALNDASKPDSDEPSEKPEAGNLSGSADENAGTLASLQPKNESPRLEIAEDDLIELEELQSRTSKRTRLLAPKAESELEQLENTPANNNPDADAKHDDASDGPPSIDPEQAKEGFRKAIELAPQAVEHMEAVVRSLKQKDRQNAARRSEDARKILEEIQRAQPKNDQKQDQNKQDQQQNDDQKKQDDQKDDDQKEDQQKSDDQKPEQKKSEDQKQQKQDQQKQQPQVSQDRVEDALRKVRERQQEKRERDRKLKGQFLGRAPVDKDW